MSDEWRSAGEGGYVWRTRDYVVEVIRPGETEPWIPLLTPAELKLLERDVVDAWGEKVLLGCNRPPGLPIGYAFGFIYAESMGHADAHASDGGLGLFQITNAGWKKGHTDAEIMNPDTNIDLGTSAMLKIMTQARTEELPEIASIYNAGGAVDRGFWKPHHSDISEWRMRETRGHITRVVRASNTFYKVLAAGLISDPPAEPEASGGLGPAVNCVSLDLYAGSL